MFGWTCGDCRLLFFCRRAMGGGQRPAFPAPSDCEGDRFAKLGRGWRREAADVYPSACVGDTKWELQRRHCERSEAIQDGACGSGWLSTEVHRNDGAFGRLCAATTAVIVRAGAGGRSSSWRHLL